jgi:hypothetical protein
MIGSIEEGRDELDLVSASTSSSYCSVQIRSRSSAAIAWQLQCGRRDRGSTASQPPAW